MMNKYQESFNNIVVEAELMAEKCNHDLAEDIKVIQKLVDKEKPKEPKYNKQLSIVGCPTCDFCDMMWGVFKKYERCPKCGQVIDWSEEE